MRVLVIANRGDGDPGWVGEHLTAVHGARLLRAWREEPESWPELDGIDLVVTLGSDWSAYWEHVGGFVQSEMALVRAVQQQRRPMLGICFGAQVAAQALGGRVEPAPEPEVGWYSLDVMAGAPFDAGPWFQWHADRYQPPASATVLAQTARATQAFTVGRILAVQFHPEVTPAMVERWSSGDGEHELQRLGADRAAVVAATAQQAPQRRDAAGGIVDWVLAST